MDRAMDYLFLIPLVPFVVGLVLGIAGRFLPRSLPGAAASLAMASSLWFTARAVFDYSSLPAGCDTVRQVLWTWIETRELRFDLALMVDPLTLLMMLVVSGIGLLIHVYSIGYMAEDEDQARYFCQLNLFAGFMLLLVMAANLPVMFIGWEGVGACSYLLIGYFFTDEEKAAAGRKAFLVNRVGDAFFVLGLLALLGGLVHAGLRPTLDFTELRNVADRIPSIRVDIDWWTTSSGPGASTSIGLAGLVSLLFFLGATGKSAQIPLYVWLPDAMAGPTPVSALIHAATMVTAGVYMVCRLSFLFSLSATAMTIVAWTGAATALLAGVIATCQSDLKKILAYSTISQLGYMFLAAGVGAFSAAMFHVFTHAFFKALLFLGAGSVIHALHGEQDVFKMGGLGKRLPWTYGTFLIGAAAISGVPILSGFFSKDLILFKTYLAPGGAVLYVFGLAGAMLTSFYMFRLVSLVFWGESRLDRKTKKAIHEAPPSMMIALVLLALGSLTMGFVNMPEVLHGSEWLTRTLDTVLVHGEAAAAHGSHWLEIGLMMVSITVALAGIVMAWRVYSSPEFIPTLESLPHLAAYRLVQGKFHVDEGYGLLVVRPLLALARFFRFADERFIDRVLVEGSGGLVGWCSGLLRTVQSGEVQRYLVLVMVGVTAIVIYLVRAP